MLGGLEAAEVKFSDLEAGTRFDAEMYLKEYIQIEHTIRQTSHTELYRQAGTIKKGIFDIKADCYVEKGIPFVRISNLRNMITDDSDIIFIPESEHERNDETALRRNDIILSKTAYPAASLVTFDECNTSQDTIAVKLMDDSQVKSHFLVTFLNTKYGLKQMRRWFSGNVQMHLNLTDCKNLLISIPSSVFQSRIEQIFEASIQKKKESQDLYLEAESLLLEELGLKDWQPPEETTAIKSFSESYSVTGRIDAEFYQPKYQQILAKLSRSGLHIGEVAKLSKLNFNPRGVNAFKYIEIGSLTGEGIAEPDEVSIEDAPSRAQWVVRKGDVITSTVRPIRRLSALIEPEQDGDICSSGFAVLTPERVEPEVLLTFLRAPIICEILDLHTTASMYPAISTDDLLHMPITLPSTLAREKIVRGVQNSKQARKDSVGLLEIAKHGVEIAIEHDEAAALAWMDEQTRRVDAS